MSPPTTRMLPHWPPHPHPTACRLAPPRALHHGTLLINVDMSALGGLLNPNKLKMQSKGIQSVVSRVTNLSALNGSLSHEALTAELIETFKAHYGWVERLRGMGGGMLRSG